MIIINQFFAVTKTSIYQVTGGSKKKPYPVARKIAVRGESSVSVGGELQNGTMLAITKELQMYVPEGGGVTSLERKIEMVNTRFWGGHSTEIVALFVTMHAAYNCFRVKRKKTADPRWLKATKGVLDRIGDNHPTIYVCKWGDLNLLS